MALHVKERLQRTEVKACTRSVFATEQGAHSTQDGQLRLGLSTENPLNEDPEKCLTSMGSEILWPQAQVCTKLAYLPQLHTQA